VTRALPLLRRPRRPQRRPPRPLLALAAAAALLAVGATACGDTRTAGASSDYKKDGVLRTAFFSDMQVPDPDIFYEVEGNQVTNTAYEGLVRYKTDGSTTIEPWLASKYEVSADKKTYTFTLRDNVTFHDGTKLDSAAAKFSFERRVKVNSAPAYMLADVASYQTPDPLTFVIKLKQPVSPFLDYLAAPYGPKMVSPALIKAHEVKNDAAQGWIKTHDAGTGPYGISEFSLGQRYVLTRYDRYWGGTPFFRQLIINIIPDASTQQIQLQGGDLDFVHQQPIDTIEQFRNKSGYQVVGFPVLQKTYLHINEHKGPFRDVKLRRALGAAIDRKTLVQQIYQDVAKPSTQMYPVGELAPDLGKDAYTVNPQTLKDAVAKLPANQRAISLTYATGSVNDQRMTESLQNTLTGLGLKVTIVPKTIAQIFAMVDQNPKTLPDIIVETANPDAAHPDTWARIFYRTGGALNYLQASTPAADAEMDRGLHLTDKAAVDAAYGKAADLLHDDATFITIDDITDTFIVRNGLAGLEHQIPMPFVLRVGSLKASEG
jgi:peptide/nickel transport system substrate-binding protein